MPYKFDGTVRAFCAKRRPSYSREGISPAAYGSGDPYSAVGIFIGLTDSISFKISSDDLATYWL